MSEFKLYIRTDNAAFGDQDETVSTLIAAENRNPEIARILRYVADELERMPHYALMGSATLRDVNGNDVGRAVWRPE